MSYWAEQFWSGNLWADNFWVGLGGVNSGDRKVGRNRGKTKIQYRVKLGDQVLLVNSLDEAETLIDQYERSQNTQRKVRRVITDSISLDLDALPFKTRERFVKRAADVDYQMSERPRYVQRAADTRPTEMTQRNRFVTREPKKKDMLAEILKKREK